MLIFNRCFKLLSLLIVVSNVKVIAAQEAQIVTSQIKVDAKTDTKTYLLDVVGDSRKELIQIVGIGGLDTGVEGYISKLSPRCEFIREKKPFFRVLGRRDNRYSAAWDDTDKDGDLDLYITQIPFLSLKLETIYFENDGKGNFTNKGRINMSNYKNQP